VCQQQFSQNIGVKVFFVGLLLDRCKFGSM